MIDVLKDQLNEMWVDPNNKNNTKLTKAEAGYKQQEDVKICYNCWHFNNEDGRGYDHSSCSKLYSERSHQDPWVDANGLCKFFSKTGY
jgi:hypothetical protein